jgi:hypothetical protein
MGFRFVILVSRERDRKLWVVPESGWYEGALWLFGKVENQCRYHVTLGGRTKTKEEGTLLTHIPKIRSSPFPGLWYDDIWYGCRHLLDRTCPTKIEVEWIPDEPVC